MSVPEATARAWCWAADGGVIDPNVEDLFLMDDALAIPLLEEAARWCPRRDESIAIVAHHARDAAHDAVERGAYAARADVYARWLPRARAVDVDLAAYLERLIRYAARGPVDEPEARSRGLDLARCHAPAEVAVVRDGTRWRVASDHAVLVVDAYNGAMCLEALR